VSFATPTFLIGLVLIPVVIVLYVRSERRPQSFAPALLLPSVAPTRAGWRRHVAVTGYGVALAALLVALAKPQTTVAVATEQARVMIVTDRSGSMLAKDVAPNRLAAAKEAAGRSSTPSRTRCASARWPSITRRRCCSRRRATTRRCARR
jgi:Ca-activated chloride channel family protein